MPEGDTVHRTAAYLAERLLGRAVRSVRLGRGPKIGLGCPSAPGPLPGLEGRAVEEVSAEGKHLWIRFEGGLALRSHLGLHGSWHRYGLGEPWQKPAERASLVLETDEDVLVCFQAREVECLRSGGFRRTDLAARLGPDLLSPDVDIRLLPARARRLLAPETALTDVLLHQRVAGGIGNVYKSEVLFLRRANPFGCLADLPDEALAALFETARELLRKNLGPGSRTTRFADDGRGRLWVYGRAGRPCFTCGTRIRYGRSGASQRSTYWCPRCQETPPGAGPS